MKTILFILSILFFITSCSIDKKDIETIEEIKYNSILIEQQDKDNIEVIKYKPNNKKESIFEKKDIVLVDNIYISNDNNSDKIQWLNKDIFIKLISNYDESNWFDPKLLWYDFQKIDINSWTQEIIYSLDWNKEIIKWLLSEDKILLLVEEYSKIVFYEYLINQKLLKKIWIIYEWNNTYNARFSEIQKLWNNKYWFLMEKENEDEIFSIEYNNASLSILKAFSYNEVLENWKINVNFISPDKMCFIWDNIIYTKQYLDNIYELINYNIINKTSEIIDWSLGKKEYIRKMKCINNELFFEKNIIWDTSNRYIYNYDIKNNNINKIINGLLINVNEDILIYEYQNKIYLYDLENKTNHILLEKQWWLINIYIK